jgi:uncharacterized membrane protein
MGIGNRIAPARFIGFTLAMIAASALAMAVGLTPGRALMLGFDLASAGFLGALWPLLDDESDDMRRRARDNDANRAGLLALTGLVMLVILVAVANELGGPSQRDGAALVIVTLALAWLFSNTVYALHYAHLFYSQNSGKDAGGLDFPDDDEPDYWDFVYFAFTLGMTFQTSDVSIANRAMRRVVTGHCLAAFVFNLGVIAFTINVLGN